MAKYKITINGKSVEADLVERRGSHVSFLVDGDFYQVDVEPLLQSINENAPSQRSRGTVAVPVAASQTKTSTNDVVSPMPGIVVHVPVKIGQVVQIGECVMVIEAMKMENNIAAHKTGTIKSIHVKVGEEVSGSKALITLE